MCRHYVSTPSLPPVADRIKLDKSIKHPVMQESCQTGASTPPPPLQKLKRGVKLNKISNLLFKSFHHSNPKEILFLFLNIQDVRVKMPSKYGKFFPLCVAFRISEVHIMIKSCYGENYFTLYLWTNVFICLLFSSFNNVLISWQ